MKTLWRWFGFSAFVILGFVQPSHAQEVQIPPLLTEWIPGYCALSENKKVLYFPRSDNRFAALEIATGKILWVSAEKAKPLAAQKDNVLALINEKPGQIRLAAYAATSGKITNQSDPYELPLPETSLAVEAGTAGKQYYVSMKRSADAKEEPANDKKQLGTLYFDASTGKIEWKVQQSGTLIVVPKMARLEQPRNMPPARLQAYPEFVSGDNVIQVYYGQANMAAYVFAVHWDRQTGKHLENKPIYVNQFSSYIGSIFPIANGRYVLLRTASKEGPGLYSAETGKRILTTKRGLQLGWRAEPLILAVQRDPDGKAETKLTAYQLSNGKIMWTQACHSLVGR